MANHTSPLDVMILSTDNVYAMVGQKQGGVLGFVQRTLSQAADHIWFERSVANDRSLVLKALKEHFDDPNKLPIIIFPEGTCINNTSVMQFKKGSFEVRGLKTHKKPTSKPKNQRGTGIGREPTPLKSFFGIVHKKTKILPIAIAYSHRLYMNYIHS